MNYSVTKLYCNDDFYQIWKFYEKKISNRLSMQTGAVQQNETNLHNKCILKN